MNKRCLLNGFLKANVPQICTLTTTARLGKDHYKLLIVGGGTGGLTSTQKFAKYVGDKEMAIIEPRNVHYYQPGWTMVGAGMIDFEQTVRPIENLIQKNCVWIRDKVGQFLPDKNSVVTKSGKEIGYDFLIMDLGLEQKFDWIKGLPEAFETPGVCSNYSPIFVKKTFPCMQNFGSGNAIFTAPFGTINCPAAPMKICYLAEDYMRKKNFRSKAKVLFKTGKKRLFPVEKYERSMLEIMKSRDIELETSVDLTEVNADTKEAVFRVLEPDTNKTLRYETHKYEMLHVAPPCGPVKELVECKELVNDEGYVKINAETMQHLNYANIFAVGDCASTDTPKSAASISSQLAAIRVNLKAVMDGRQPTAKFDGYASCPILTGYRKCIIAEFNRENIVETLPIDQSKERYIFYLMKRYFLPFVYWNLLLKGHWEGPKYLRKLAHFGFSK